MPTRDVDYETALEIASHEAIIRQAYKDSVGVWTWSVGITSASGHDVERYIGKPQSLEHCLAVYVWALRKYTKDVLAAFGSTPLAKHEFAAALSFHWNTGAIKKASWVKKFKAGDRAGAKIAFMQWKKPPEIIGRRTKERDLFFDGKWSNDGTMTEYTRLTAKSTPVWSSAKKINVEKELRAAFGLPKATSIPAPKPLPPIMPAPTVPLPPAPPAPRKRSYKPAIFIGVLLALIIVGGAIYAALN